MIEGILHRVGQYTERTDTPVARALARTFPETGIDYITSRKKRALELTVAVPLTVAALPLMAGVAIAIKAEGIVNPESRGPVIYKAQRYDQNGEIFNMWKFRSLRVGADRDVEGNMANANTPGRPADARSTRVGAILRASHLDELPQCLHVLTGTMSLIGPRAEDVPTREAMRQAVPNLADKLVESYNQAKPGLFNPTVAYGDGTPRGAAIANLVWERTASAGHGFSMAFRNLVRDR